MKLQVIALSVVTLLLISGCSPEKDNSTLTVGLLATLSGPAAVHGEHVVMGAEAAIDELRAQGMNIELVVQDNENNPKAALSAYRTLLVDKPDIIFTTMSGASAAIIPLAEEEGIPVITSLTYADFREYPNVYQYFQTTEDISFVAAESFRKRGMKKVALLSSNIEAGHALMEIATKEFSSQGISVDSIEYYPPQEEDYSVQILKAIKNDPDAVFVFDLRPDKIVSQLKQHYTKTIVFTDTPVATNIYRDPIMNGTFAMAQEYMISGTDEHVKFTSTFKGKDPNAEAGMGYDVIHLIAKTFDATAWPSSVTNKKSFTGLAGEIDLASSRKPSIPITFVEIQEGKLVEVQE